VQGWRGIGHETPHVQKHLGAMLRDSRVLRVDAGQRQEADKISVLVDGAGPSGRDRPNDGS
jgi:hypothetical protein